MPTSHDSRDLEAQTEARRLFYSWAMVYRNSNDDGNNQRRREAAEYGDSSSIYWKLYASEAGISDQKLVETLGTPASLTPYPEQKQEDSLPSTLCDQPPRLEVPSLAPHTAAGGDLAAVLAAINATILGLEARLTTRLDAQDERIRELSTPSKPPQPVTAKRAKGQATVAAAPGPNTPSSSPGVRETVTPVPRVDDPTSHDHVEEIQTPGVAASAADAQQPAPKAHVAHVVREAFRPPPEKHVRLNVDARGKPTPSTSMPPSWAKITAASAGSKPTPHSPPPKPQPPPAKGRTTGASGNTKVTINRHHGLEDAAFEATIRKMTPAAILAETRTEVDRLTGGKLALLSRRWSKNRNAAIHNFVYTFKGQVPFKAIYPLRDVLVKPLMTGQLVPNDGWTHAQIRDTNTSNNEGRVYTNKQLETELRRNPAFEDAVFCIAPHWQGSRHTVALNPRGTVAFAYVDGDNRITSQATRDGVFLFNEKTNFIPVGDSPTIIMCGRCHHIGHATDSTACPLPANCLRCHICGGAHHSDDHAAHCPKPHDKVGKCRCLFPCLNCHGEHNARSPRCPLKKGFAPPDLVANPATDATAPPSAKGKAKATAPEQLVPTQREPLPAPAAQTPTTTEDDQFVTVTRKRSRKGKARAKEPNVQAANASVPGSLAAASQSARRTAKVPARPVYQFPTPPTWKEAPVIHKRHVATDLECATALRRIFRREPTVDDLRSAKCRIIKESKHSEAEALQRFDDEWGPVGPRTYLFSTIPQEQYFSQPGDLEEVELPADTVQHNRNMARTLVNTIIQFKRLEAKANGTPPPPDILEMIVDSLLDTYSHGGTYSFFGLASTGADDSIWTALIDTHAFSTTALESYA
ncbi:hypothetical protein EDB86DRAFT_3166275 [Lactarius hatsudake]|nr:hypothetical protein EDB86DRAFT_3166275 [Lactarius hatsudake]